MINPLVYFVLFIKASLFSSGGISNLPSLHQDLLANGWAHEEDFGKSIAIGQLSPGPNGLWVISLGYITYGWIGAALSLIAITIPPLLVLLVDGLYHQIENQRWVPGLMRGISLGVVGIQLTASWNIISHSGSDWRGWLIAVGACIIALNKRINLLVILALAGLAGYFIFRL